MHSMVALQVLFASRSLRQVLRGLLGEDLGGRLGVQEQIANLLQVAHGDRLGKKGASMFAGNFRNQLLLTTYPLPTGIFIVPVTYEGVNFESVFSLSFSTNYTH